MTIEPNPLVIAWMIEYVSYLLNMFEAGNDGKTAYERLRSKKSKVLGLEFGEAVQWRKIIRGDRQNKLDTVWDDGVYAGHKTISGESIIVTKGGVEKREQYAENRRSIDGERKTWSALYISHGKLTIKPTRPSLLWRIPLPLLPCLGPPRYPKYLTTQ